MPLSSSDDLDPGTVKTLEQLALLLRRLHVRAGRPSLRQLEKWAQAQNAAGRHGVSLTRSSVSDALNGRRLPRKDFVRWFVEACLVPAEQREHWLKAWERVADHHLIPPGPAPSRSGDRSDAPATVPGEIQPLFADILLVTVFMRGRSVHRRVTERLVTARADGVTHYLARGYVGTSRYSTFSAIRALWGCEAEVVGPGQSGFPATRLTFPAPLRAGEKAHFASEVLMENDREERHWVEVNIDHRGIARGETSYDGVLPTAGLTIRIRFDKGEVPRSVWWYENPDEEARTIPPVDPHRILRIVGQDVRHTFVERPCESGEIFGLAFAW